MIEIGGLPFTLDDGSQQLGGYEATIGASASYRLSVDNAHRRDILGEVFGKKVWLNSEAKEAAPGIKGSDFDYGALIFGLRETRLIWPDLGPSQATALLGQSWSGGQRQAHWLELRGSQVVRQTDNRQLRFGANLREEKRNEDPINDARSLGVSGEWILTGTENQRTTLGLAVTNISSDSATVDSLSYRFSASHSFGLVGQVRPRLSGSLETRDYQKWSATAGGRQDDTLSVKLDVVFPNASFYGFVPQAGLGARRVWSNVDIYDRNALSLSLTAVSRF